MQRNLPVRGLAPDATDWWRSAVIFEIYPRSFADANGDGIGDIRGIAERLPYLAELGVDAIWIAPWYPSPLQDGGHDIADYCGIDPVFGTLADAEDLLARARGCGLRVILDFVANHTSDQHPLFQQAIAAAPGSPERDRYFFRDGRGAAGDEPPNNWISAFGGRAWTRTTDANGQPGGWYLHLFAPEQPDVNWQTRTSGRCSTRWCGAGSTAGLTASGSTPPEPLAGRDLPRNAAVWQRPAPR